MKTAVFHVIFLLTLCFMSMAHAMLHVIAAENVYGSVAEELGGPYVEVKSIINNPTQDPHLFSVAPSMIQSLQMADIIIYNGAGYDAWIDPLLSNNSAHILQVATLIKNKANLNPHIWYQPDTIPLFAKALTDLYIQLDPAQQPFYIEQLKIFKQHYQKLYQTIAAMRKQYAGTSIIATESLFNPMADSMGLVMHGLDFQLSIMNDVAPSPAQIQSFENDLRNHTVRLLIYNKQMIHPMIEYMLSLAKQNNIPVVGITEILPEGQSYLDWMLAQLHEISQSLQDKPPLL